MKKILYILAFIATTFATAQTIDPLLTTEMCPNQEYTFTVSSLPGNYESITTIGEATITTTITVSSNQRSITFKGKFADVSGIQGFAVKYVVSNTILTYDFNFTKVKSFFSGYKVGSAPSQIVAPICQTTPIALNITGDQYWNTSTNPYSSFGSINSYEYIIPSGWYLNSTLSNGNNWITASGNITLTPNINTGNGSAIQYRAINDCSNAFFKGNIKYIPVSRPNPTFTISPTSLAFVCGTPQTRTFTVSTPIHYLVLFHILGLLEQIMDGYTMEVLLLKVSQLLQIQLI
ncbi:MAG: hypothetical protein Q8J84_10925 [Flavobacteriaceae bacterium]|nr:hypothetical protein [Flavobacteriaceae bacterium]